MIKSLIIVSVIMAGVFAHAAQSSLTEKDLIGQYSGTCKDQFVETKEALYIRAFKNFVGKTQILPITTLQFYGGFEIPERLKYLTSGSAKNLKDIAEFVRQGYTGVDNNQGIIGTGVDYAYVYNATISTDHKTLTLKVSDVKTSDLNPPILRGCGYGNVNGLWLFEGCHASNDQTVFTKNAHGQLVSLRTADERVRGTNNLSFRLPAIQKHCSWTKLN